MRLFVTFLKVVEFGEDNYVCNLSMIGSPSYVQRNMSILWSKDFNFDEVDMAACRMELKSLSVLLYVEVRGNG